MRLYRFYLRVKCTLEWAARHFFMLEATVPSDMCVVCEHPRTVAVGTVASVSSMPLAPGGAVRAAADCTPEAAPCPSARAPVKCGGASAALLRQQCLTRPAGARVYGGVAFDKADGAAAGAAHKPHGRPTGRVSWAEMGPKDNLALVVVVFSNIAKSQVLQVRSAALAAEGHSGGHSRAAELGRVVAQLPVMIPVPTHEGKGLAHPHPWASDATAQP